jgi:hypothetical protein
LKSRQHPKNRENTLLRGMRTALFLLIAAIGTIYGQQQPQLSEPLKWTEPVPAQIVGEIPPGWEIVELKDQKVTHGPFQLPDGQKVTLTTPKYVLQPILDNEHAALYLLEPGFNLKDLSGNPRAGTLSFLLYTEMEALRISSENLRPLMAQIAKVQEYVRQQQQSGSAAVPLPGLNPGSQPIEPQSPELPPVASPVPTPAPAAAPSASPSNSPPAPAASESSPTPGPSPSATPARTHHAKKLQKTTSRPAGEAATTPSPERTSTPKKRLF